MESIHLRSEEVRNARCAQVRNGDRPPASSGDRRLSSTRVFSFLRPIINMGVCWRGRIREGCKRPVQVAITLETVQETVHL